jgi:hypothetical protein
MQFNCFVFIRDDSCEFVSIRDLHFSVSHNVSAVKLVKLPLALVDNNNMSIEPSTMPTLEERCDTFDINDRRRRPRLLSRTTGWVFLGDDDHAPAREILVVDVSRLGVGFVSETKLDEGFVCRVRIGFGPRRLARRLKISNCRKNEQGTFVIGGEFV